jgi:hypothetical protein
MTCLCMLIDKVQLAIIYIVENVVTLVVVLALVLWSATNGYSQLPIVSSKLYINETFQKLRLSSMLYGKFNLHIPCFN